MFIAKTFDKDKNLSKEIHVLRAIRWGIQAWEEDVTPTTIQSYWRRSQCINFGSFPLPSSNIWTESEETIELIRQRLVQIRNRGLIQSIPNIKDYISLYSGPWSERIDDHIEIELEELVDEICNSRGLSEGSRRDHSMAE